MSTEIQPATGRSRHPEAKVVQVIVYGHSALFYWWPLWVVGYVMALLTWLHHDQAVIGDKPEWFYPSRNLGVIYTLLLLLLVVVTSIKIKGMKAALIIATLAFLALLFVHLDWWDAILGWVGHQSISLSLGFYLFSSSLLLLVWLTSVFVIDHLSFWRFRPGEVTHEYLAEYSPHIRRICDALLCLFCESAPFTERTTPGRSTACFAPALFQSSTV